MVVIGISIKESDSKTRTLKSQHDFVEGKVSFMSGEIKEAMEELDTQGICMRKFKGDIITYGVDYSALNIGDGFQIGGAQFLVSGVGKKCHSGDCTIYEADRECLIQKGVMFASVIKKGTVTLDDEIRWL